MNTLRCSIVIVTLCLQMFAAFGLYDGNNDVKIIQNSNDFKETVLDSDQIWLVQFYSPSCGHCKKFQPAYSKIAGLFKGIVPFAAVDATTDGPQKDIAKKYAVNGFPTTLIFGLNKDDPTKVQARDPNALTKEILLALEAVINSRATALKIDPNNGDGERSKSSKSSSSGSQGGASNKVVELTASNFEEKVYNSDDVVLVFFGAPWCGHCKQLHPEWEEAAAKLDGTGATLAYVDATVEEALAQQYRVQGYPTIKIFPGGKGKSASSAIDYNGGRQSSQIVQAALAEVDRSGVPKEIPELVNEDVLKENCEGSGKLCVFFAFPHILDSGAAGRNKYKDLMAEASKAVRGMGFNFIWFEGGSQYDLENALELTFGFPAVAAYSADKGVYAVHRGSFTEKNIRKFLTGITTGNQRTYKVQKPPKIYTVEPWDGKDGVPIEEEPLEDIMGWDDDDEEPEL